MPFINADRIKETTTTTGTGNIALAGAVLGFRAFYPTLSVGDTFKYFIVSTSGTEWESGLGTLTASSTLARTTVQSSSNVNPLTAVNFSAGLKEVGIGPTAGGETPWNPVTNTLDISVNALNDVAITSPTVNQVLKYSGTEWTNQADAVNVGTVTSVSGAGTVSGLTLTGTVTSSGSLTFGGAISTLNQSTTGNAATVTTNANLTGHVTSVGNAAVLGSFTSAQLAGALTDETGTGANVFATSPTLVTPLTNSLSAIPIVSGLTASVTAATGASGIITYTASNTFTVGRTVSVTGLTTASGTTLNIAGMTIATASSTQFTVVNATVGVSSGTGTATAGGNTIATSASNAVTAGPGGNYIVTAGSGVGVGKGGDIILQPGAQGSSGGDGITRIYRPDGTTGLKLIARSGTNVSGLFSRAFGEDVASGSGDLAVASANGYFYLTGYTVLRFTNSDLLATGLGGFSSPNADIYVDKPNGVLRILRTSDTTGGSLSFPSTTEAIAANTNNLALTASAFQRLNCTLASSLTGIAPPSGGAHVDGRMIRVYNVGTANLTLTHNSGLSTAANRFWNSTAADIILATNDYAELIYDSTSNGSGASGWRAS